MAAFSLWQAIPPPDLTASSPVFESQYGGMQEREFVVRYGMSCALRLKLDTRLLVERLSPKMFGTARSIGKVGKTGRRESHQNDDDGAHGV